jgi:hypothetical protein
MTFDGTTTFAESPLEQVAIQTARNQGGEGGTSSRKHFIDAYAEHLEVLKRGHTTR